MGLWLKWIHCASLVADTSCELIQLDSKQFKVVAKRFATVLPFVRHYSHLFVAMMRNSGGAWCTDLWTQTSDLDELAVKACTEAAKNENRSSVRHKDASSPLNGGAATHRVNSIRQMHTASEEKPKHTSSTERIQYFAHLFRR